MKRKESGFTLIELMIVIAIIAIIASIAIPNLMSSRMSANEAAAIATLRNLHSAQDQFQAMGVVDQDQLPPNNTPDGRGEFGFFAELAGTSVPRSNSPTPPTIPITPGVMPSVFGMISPVNGEGTVSRSGYIFKIFLPDTAGAPFAEPVALNYAAVAADANNQEAQWCAYAWPENAGVSGARVFFVDATGEVTQFLNEVGGAYVYNGTASDINAGNALAAFAGATMMGPHAANGVGQDGNFWTSVGN